MISARVSSTIEDCAFKVWHYTAKTAVLISDYAELEKFNCRIDLLQSEAVFVTNLGKYCKVRQLYYKVGQTLLQSSADLLYYEVGQELMQKGTGNLLWSEATLSKSEAGIIKVSIITK